MAAQVFAEATSRPYTAFIDVPPRRLLVGLVLYPLLLSIPVTTAYAVLVHRVMDVKVLVRRAVQYALARFTIVGLGGGAGGCCSTATLVRNRDQTIGGAGDALVGDGRRSVPLSAVLLVVLGGAAAAAGAPPGSRHVLPRGGRHAGAAGRRWPRRRSRRWRHVSTSVVPRRSAEQVRDTLHLAQADVLVADAEAGRLLSPAPARLRPLALDSRAGRGAGRPARTRWSSSSTRPGGWVQRAAAGGAAVAGRRRRPRGDAAAVDGPSLVGVMALGEKLNDLPFSERRPRALLAPVAAALALKEVEKPAPAPRAGRRPGGRAADGGRAPATADAPAVVCVRCACRGQRGAQRAGACVCGGEVAPSRLPAVLAGKVRLERELGRGGMGVVYLAFDTALESAGGHRDALGREGVAGRIGAAAARGAGDGRLRPPAPGD